MPPSSAGAIDTLHIPANILVVMSEPVTWAAVGMAAVSNMAVWLIILKGRRSNRNDAKESNPGPGQAEVCIERGEKITRIETKQENYDEDIREIKADIKAIRGAVAKD